MYIYIYIYIYIYSTDVFFPRAHCKENQRLSSEISLIGTQFLRILVTVSQVKQIIPKLKSI